MSDFTDRHLGKIFIAASVLILAALFAVGDLMARRACGIYEEAAGTPTRYYTLDTCYVQRDGRWWRWDEYKLAYATTASEAVQ